MSYVITNISSHKGKLELEVEMIIHVVNLDWTCHFRSWLSEENLASW